MKQITVILGLLTFLRVAGAQPAPADSSFITRSYSGQFAVNVSGASTDPRLASQLTEGGRCTQFSPSLLVVSCERIKLLLWRKLAEKPSWRGRIIIDLRATRSANENVRIVSERFSDGWRYRVQMPDVIENERFVRAIVQALLLEIANRGATTRSAELPLWLVEGISHELVASGTIAGELKIFLPPPTAYDRGLYLRRDDFNERRTNSLYWARVVLGSQAPLTFDELSWPAEDQLSSAMRDVYQSSAQLFVVRLLEFKDGPASFHTMLNELPRYLNWQLAFLNAFKPHFQSLLAVEKWWAVQVSHFTGRELEQTWSAAESWRKLDAAIRASVQVNTGAGAQPLRTEVKMQTLLRDSNGIAQGQFFRQKLESLNSVRLRVSPELIGLVDDYRQVIGAFLAKEQSTNPFLPFRKYHELVVNRAARDLIRQLDALEIKRESLRPFTPEPDANEQDTISAAFR